MYCQQCGMHNVNEATACQVCGADLASRGDPRTIKIFADLTQLPLKALISSIIRSYPLLSPLFIPIFTLLYGFKKLTGSPFFSLNLNYKTPRFHQVDLNTLPRLHRQSFQKASSFLRQQGFTPFFDLEDVSLVQASVQHLEIQREHNIYATLHINKASGKITHTTFSAFFIDGSYLSVDNAYAFPIEYPEDFVIKHVPNASLQETYTTFLQQLQQFPDAPVYFPLKQLLSLGYARRDMIIDLGLEQGIFHPKGDVKQPQARMCYHHPLNAAVRACSVCGKSLCEACYQEYQGQIYCQACLPEDALLSGAASFADEQTGYAGFGVRAVAALIDLLIIAIGGIGIYQGLSYLLRTLVPEANIRFLPFLLTQLFLVIGIAWYLIAPLKNYGSTLGQKLLGLRVIDRDGGRPELAAALIRFVYHLLAGLFIFPLLGYFFILFRKKKQGLHDQLSDTYVITRHAARKAIFSWMFLLLLFGLLGWQVYQYRWLLPGVPFGSSSSMYDLHADIHLESTWEQMFDPNTVTMTSYLNRGDYCFVSTTEGMMALDMRTGSILWTQNSLASVALQAISENPALPLVGLQYHPEDRWRVMRIEPASGAILWQHELESYGPSLTFDAETLLVYTDDVVQAYNTPEGRFLWERTFRDLLYIEYAALHSDILLGRYSESALTLTYLDRVTGERIWELKDSPYSPGYVLDRDHQFFYTDAGKSLLFHVPDRRPLWEQPHGIGYVTAHEASSGDSEHDAMVAVYTTEQVLRADTGETIFAYPADTRFGALTHDFLLLSYEYQEQHELLLLDKATGVILEQLGNTGWMGLFYLTEDDAAIYLAANLKPESPGQDSLHSVLLIIDKQTYTLTEIPVGRNIGSLQWKIYPDDQLIVITTFQQLGGYRLPEK